jgi:DNA-3-methyladenine glycosylase
MDSRTDHLRATLERDVLEASKALLGWELVRGNLRARIVETEAYRHDDPACHAFGRSQMKNMALFANPGQAYVYFTYGNHWMLNVVAHRKGDAAAVLIRAAEPLSGLEDMYLRRPNATKPEDLLSGPGKLAAAFEIGKAQNLMDLLDPASELHLQPGTPPSRVIAGPRIGIAVGKAHDYLWRYVDGDALRWVSRPVPRG